MNNQKIASELVEMAERIAARDEELVPDGDGGMTNQWELDYEKDKDELLDDFYKALKKLKHPAEIAKKSLQKKYNLDAREVERMKKSLVSDARWAFYDWNDRFK